MVINRKFTIINILKLLPATILVLAVVIIGSTVPNFSTISNFLNIFNQASGLGLLAIGITIVLITGGIDLSLPSVMALSGILGAFYMKSGGSIVIAILIMVFTGLVFGIINGIAVAYLKMIPFVVTLSTMAVATGASVLITNNVNMAGLNPKFIDFITGKIGGIPFPIIFLAIITMIVTILIKKSIFGRWLYAIGVNFKTAKVSGLPAERILFGSYCCAGLFAGIAAIIITARLSSANPMMGADNVVLNMISSAVVGGVSINGGVGSPLGAVLGALIIQLISNSMNMMEISYYTTLIVKGLVIITFIALDREKAKT